MADKAWKANERRMARDVGTERIPVTGERNGADFQDDYFSYQLKVRKIIPSWIAEWLLGIRTTAERTQRIGVLVLKRPGERDEDASVVVSWADWLAIQKVRTAPYLRNDAAVASLGSLEQSGE